MPSVSVTTTLTVGASPGLGCCGVCVTDWTKGGGLSTRPALGEAGVVGCARHAPGNSLFSAGLINWMEWPSFAPATGHGKP